MALVVGPVLLYVVHLKTFRNQVFYSKHTSGHKTGSDLDEQVIVAGKKEAVTKALQEAQRYREDLLKRGVVVVPIVWSGADKVEPVKKRGFGSSDKPTPPLSSAPAPVGVSPFSQKLF